jgi:hypothetical protein
MGYSDSKYEFFFSRFVADNLARAAFGSNRHREERSDAAIRGREAPDDSWIASLRSQ